MANSRAIEAGRAFLRLHVDDARFASGINKAVSRVKAFGRSLDMVGRNMTRLGAILSVPFLASIRTLSRAGVEGEKLRGTLNQLKNALTSLGNTVGQAVTPVLQKFTNVVANIVPSLQAWIDKNNTLVGSLAVVTGGVAALGVALSVLGKAIKGITTLGAIIGIAATALSGVPVPILLLLGGIGAAIIAGVRSNQAYKQSLGEVGEGLTQTTENFKELTRAAREANKAMTTQGQLTGFFGPSFNPVTLGRFARNFQLFRRSNPVATGATTAGFFAPHNLLALIGPLAAQLGVRRRQPSHGLAGFASPDQVFDQISRDFGERGTFGGAFAEQMFGTGGQSLTQQMTKLNNSQEKGVRALEEIKRNTSRLQSLGPIRVGIA